MNNSKNIIKVYTTSSGAELSISAPSTKQVITATNNKAQYFAEQAKKYSEEAKNYRDSALFYLEQNSDVTYEYINNIKSSLEDTLSKKQDSGNYALKEEIPSNISELKNDAKYITNSECNILIKDTNKTFTSNCIVEIPQRIKYTFDNGTFTLLAGSVMIFPHGTTDLSSSYPVGSNYYNSNFKVVDRQYANGLFFVWAEIQADKTTSQTGTATADSNILYVNAERNTFGFNGAGAVFSGTTKPTAGQIWYDTTNNVLNNSGDNFATYTQIKLSFPICNFAREAGAITNINQVFNGMGYIGSSQWYDKDIVGLSPNGLNSDGTYNNTEIRRTRLTVRTFGTETTPYNWQLSSNAHRDYKDYYVQDTQPALSGNWLWHNTLNNKLYGYSDSSGLRDMSGTYFVGGFGARANGVVTSFNPKQTFRAIDYNDKSQIVSWGMPSNKNINLTLGASGSTYIAPANGWFSLNKTTQNGGYIALENRTCLFRSFITSSSSSTHNISTYIPAKKGDVIVPTYNATGATVAFRFIYAEGEV